MKHEIDDIIKRIGAINEIEKRRLLVIADHFELPLHSNDDLIIAKSIAVIYDGWLLKLYAIPGVQQPEQLAYEFTAMSLLLFHTKLISKKKELEGDKK
ncbi:MAG: hypothetical protein QXZ17_12170 [Nitrososphaerota archaeon]